MRNPVDLDSLRIVDSLFKACYGENPAEDAVVEKIIRPANLSVCVEHEDKEPINEQEKSNKLVIETSKIAVFIAAQKFG